MMDRDELRLHALELAISTAIGSKILENDIKYEDASIYVLDMAKEFETYIVTGAVPDTPESTGDPMDV
jgi:hypothetical protein